MKSTSSDINANPLPIEVIRGMDQTTFQEALRRSIAERAYVLYEESSFIPGNELSHWLRAEKEILNHFNNFGESGPWIVANLNLASAHVCSAGVRVFVDQNRAVISLDPPVKKQDMSAETVIATCYIADWPASIDPETASAYLKSGILTLEVKKKL